ncbi:universal stress protein [Sandarakinorhabdus sp. DWP1-3-1]|uniref:universal stress protein n=1 Tax=Sandarakinorhabdus sp. DWP1-3-1 TaxID=2804627 RepID=UPI003CE6D925
MKSIMLHIHDDAEQGNRLQLALDLARLGGGHISCVQVAAVEPYASDPYGGLFGLAAIIDTIHDQDKLARQAIEARLAREDVAWDWRCFDGGVVETLIAQSRLADVLVVSQPMPGRHVHDHPLPIVGDVVLHTSAPVLVAPIGARGFKDDGNALLAWNGSAEAAHAMRLTVPLLKHAACVHVVEVGDDASGTPPVEAASYLVRHGIPCEVHDWPAKGRRTAVALLDAVAELDADYLVMGAYGHSRLRETVLGGVTRALIQSATVPLLLAH